MAGPPKEQTRANPQRKREIQQITSGVVVEMPPVDLGRLPCTDIVQVLLSKTYS